MVIRRHSLFLRMMCTGSTYNVCPVTIPEIFAELVNVCQSDIYSKIPNSSRWDFFTLLVKFLKYIFRQDSRELLPKDSSPFFAFPIHSLVLYADR